MDGVVHSVMTADFSVNLMDTKKNHLIIMTANRHVIMSQHVLALQPRVLLMTIKTDATCTEMLQDSHLISLTQRIGLNFLIIQKKSRTHSKYNHQLEQAQSISVSRE